MLGGSKPNPFCECATVGLRTTLHIVNSWYTTPKGGVNSAWLVCRIFYGGLLPMGWLDTPYPYLNVDALHCAMKTSYVV